MRRFLSQPISGESLAVFRILFGLLMAFEAVHYWLRGWIRSGYLLSKVYFPYYGFDWLPGPTPFGAYAAFFVFGLAGLFIAAGLFYRWAAIVSFFSFSLIFLWNKPNYLNHFYFILLVLLILIFISPHKRYSLDAIRNRKLSRAPNVRLELELLRFQMGVVYFFGGIAKINPDWLIGEPLTSWIAKRVNAGTLPEFLGESWIAFAMSYSGLLIDLLAYPALLWGKTRIWACAALFGFHIMNSQIFEIGIFPWLSLAYCLVFFDPSWPSILWNKIKKRSRAVAPPLGAAPVVPSAVWVLTAAFVLFNLFMPLRHWLYPGDVNWTEEGSRYSWRMKLRSRDNECRPFLLFDPSTNQKWQVRPLEYLPPRASRYVTHYPDLMLQFAHYLKAEWKQKGHNVMVFADCKSSLNFREQRQYIRPDVDLGSIEDSIWPAQYIIQ